jgi:transcriptional regulator with XRE-family HTH domain
MRVMARLRALRINRGLSQEQLAARAGVARYTLTRLETGKAKRVHPSTRLKIAAALGVTIADVDELRENDGGERELPHVADTRAEYDPHGAES